MLLLLHKHHQNNHYNLTLPLTATAATGAGARQACYAHVFEGQQQHNDHHQQRQKSEVCSSLGFPLKQTELFQQQQNVTTTTTLTTLTTSAMSVAHESRNCNVNGKRYNHYQNQREQQYHRAVLTDMLYHMSSMLFFFTAIDCSPYAKRSCARGTFVLSVAIYRSNGKLLR